MLNSNINKALEINSNKAVLLSIKKQTLPDPEFQNQIMDITQKWLNEA